MDIDALSPRVFLLVGLLAILPAVWYGVSRSLSAAVFAAVNVAITIGALYVAMGPIADETEHGNKETAT